MQYIDKLTAKADQMQRKNTPLAFIHAVIKKFGDDQAGYQAALVTYYGFLSLFPLLLVVTTLTGVFGRNNPELGQEIVHRVSEYFPVIGRSLEESVTGLTGTGWALVIGLLFTLYGARGVADAVRNAISHAWNVPRADRPGFPQSQLRSFMLIAGAGTGLLTASVIAGWTTGAGHGLQFKVLSVLFTVGILWLVCMFVMRLSLPATIAWRKFKLGALLTAVGIALLQLAGTFILTKQAAGLTTAYSAVFATTLGMLAWIYLQAQVLLYAVTANVVQQNKLYPRSLTGKNLTKVDQQLKP